MEKTSEITLLDHLANKTRLGTLTRDVPLGLLRDLASKQISGKNNRTKIRPLDMNSVVTSPRRAMYCVDAELAPCSKILGSSRSSSRTRRERHHRRSRPARRSLPGRRGARAAARHALDALRAMGSGRLASTPACRVRSSALMVTSSDSPTSLMQGSEVAGSPPGCLQRCAPSEARPFLCRSR